MDVKDLVGAEIREGDYLVDSRGKVYLVKETEASFQKSGLVRGHEMIRKMTTPRTTHTYCRVYDMVASSDIPDDPKAFYETLLSSVREKKRLVIQKRHTRSDKVLKEAGLRPRGKADQISN